jgi:hypothetical protein
VTIHPAQWTLILTRIFEIVRIKPRKPTVNRRIPGDVELGRNLFTESAASFSGAA